MNQSQSSSQILYPNRNGDVFLSAYSHTYMNSLSYGDHYFSVGDLWEAKEKYSGLRKFLVQITGIRKTKHNVFPMEFHEIKLFCLDSGKEEAYWKLHDFTVRHNLRKVYA